MPYPLRFQHEPDTAADRRQPPGSKRSYTATRDRHVDDSPRILSGTRQPERRTQARSRNRRKPRLSPAPEPVEPEPRTDLQAPAHSEESMTVPVLRVLLAEARSEPREP